eukprot:TRINITY_DN6699_c0_g1_i1.p1 TRINITY_DN6699_c0_g1~~TRINITY_DN6699_c0_g1_i1.p1  ORF type:complete len:1103 (+),score=282.77 TRINITY_DN6699_c0_g1_i1:80-3310(+)
MVRLSAKALMLATTLASTMVSFGGGLVMYLEGLRIVEETIQEISQVEVLSTADTLNATIATSYEATAAYSDWLTRWDGIRSWGELRGFLAVEQFARTKHVHALQCTGVYAVPLFNTVRNRSAVLQRTCWEPLGGAAWAPGGRLAFVSSYYLSEQWGSPLCNGSAAGDSREHRCAVTVRLSPSDGSFLRRSTAYSDTMVNDLAPGGRWAEQQQGWEQRDAVWWRAPEAGWSTDGTPYVYGTLMRTVRMQPASTPLWGEGYRLTIEARTFFSIWETHLRHGHDYATLVATFLNDGLGSLVLATNNGEAGCMGRPFAPGGNPCRIALGELRADMQEACVKANSTAEGRFFRTSIGGSEHWVMRRAVHRTRPPHDEMPSIYLVWMRKVSTANEQLDRDLYLFIGFVAAIFVFDLCVCVVEVREIAQPLGVLEGKMAAVAEMRLEHVGARTALSKLSEVYSMQLSFYQMVEDLRWYRSYMPQSVLCAKRTPDTAAEVPAPTGRVCIAFTDIVGSTRLWEVAPETMEDALQLHDSVARRGMARHGGYEVKTIGDSFMVAFSDPASGVLFAVGMQEELLETRWPEDPGLEAVHERWAFQRAANGDPVWNGITVRIGCSYGEMQDDRNPTTGRIDYRGQCVNLAARLEQCALHGTVHISQECYDAVAGDPRTAALQFTPRPGQSLKGIGTVDTMVVSSAKLTARLAAVLGEARDAVNPLAPARTPWGRRSSASSLSSEPNGSGGLTGHMRKEDRPSRSSSPLLMQGGTFEDLFRFAQVHGSVAAVLGTGHSLAAAGADPGAVGAQLNRTVVAVITGAARTQGKMSTVMGDCSQVCWNIIGNCAMYHTQPVLFAATFAGGDAKVAVGIGAGLLLHGSVGTQKHRYTPIVGLPTQIAEAAAAEACDMRCTCLAGFIHRIPPLLEACCRPVDTWATSLSEQADPVTIWEPALDKVDGATKARWDSPDIEALQLSSQDSPVLPGALPAVKPDRSLSALYHRALEQGDRGALAALAERAQQQQRDAMLTLVAGRLKQHLADHPQGRSYRVAAPFLKRHSGFGNFSSLTEQVPCPEVPSPALLLDRAAEQ